MIPLVDSEDPDQIAHSPIWAFTVGMCPKTRFGIAWRGPCNKHSDTTFYDGCPYIEYLNKSFYYMYLFACLNDFGCVKQ